MKKFFIRKKLVAIICSYIDSRYEPLYYAAAKELNIKYYNYDYSLGYPINETRNLRYLPDTRKFSDVIFASSIFRMEQYKIYSKFLDNPPQILHHICPQTDYSFNKKISSSNTSPSIIKIGLIDNAFNQYYSINSGDINTLLNLLRKTNYKIQFILQSKRGHLEKEFVRLNLSNFVSGDKGDFSKLANSDLLISIGWQSIALKAASIFKYL